MPANSRWDLIRRLRVKQILCCVPVVVVNTVWQTAVLKWASDRTVNAVLV